MLDVIQLSVLTDNYIYLLHDSECSITAVIDPAVAEPILQVLKTRGWSLNFILNTHHHTDHIGANLTLKQQTGCQVIGSAADQLRIPGIDKRVVQGDEINLGHHIAQVIASPGHTSGHITYYFPASAALFCGDTLFSMGCGRLFEGTAEQMWQSLQHIKTLPEATKIYCAHEYTQANAQFALTLEPNNQLLQQRVQQVNELRAHQQPTVPSTLRQELDSNPFLREDSPEIQRTLNMRGRSPCTIFAQIRKLKDHF